MFSFIKKTVGKVAEVAKSTAGKIAAFIGIASVSAVASAQEAVTLPNTGLDIGAYVTAGITALAGVLAVVVGGYFAFLLIKKAMRWAGRALG